MATAIKRPISTEMKTTPRKAPMHAVKSNLSIFQMIIMALISTRFTTAAMMIAARIALGRYLNKGVMNSNVNRTIMDMTMLETAVWQPAM